MVLRKRKRNSVKNAGMAGTDSYKRKMAQGCVWEMVSKLCL